MKRAFFKLFNLYAGEERQASLLAILGFLWALAISLGLRFSDVMFLLHVGAENLPTVYGISSTIMIILTAFLLYAYHNIDTHRVYLTLIAVAGSIYTLLLAIAQSGIENRIFWYALRIVGTLFMALFTTGFWTFVDQYYTLQDAKRLYSLFSSSIFLGIATTGFILQLGFIELNGILLFIVLALSGVGYIVWKLERDLTPVHDENSLQESASQGDLPFFSLMRMIRRSPFTLLLMASNFVIFVTMIVTEYNYLESFERHFPAEGLMVSEGEQTPLAHFLGRCLTGISLANLLIGLFIYSRFIHRFGLGSALPITGIILVFNYLGWMASDSLIFAIIGIAVVEGTLYVIDDSNFNLLLNAVPSRLKFRVRIFIESFFEPFGMLVSSLLLTGFAMDSKFLGCILAIIILSLALLLSRSYGRAIYLNLAENAICFHRNIREWLSQKSEKTTQQFRQQLLEKLQTGTDEEKLLAAEGLLSYEDYFLCEKILSALSSSTLSTKKAFLKHLSSSRFCDDPAVIETLHQWCDTASDENFLHSILFQLACRGFLHPEKTSAYLESSSLLLKGAAIAALKKSWAHLPPIQAAQNQLRAVQYQQQLLSSRIDAEAVLGLILIGIDGAAYDAELLIPFLKDQRPTVAVQAMETFALLADARYFRYTQLLSHQLIKNSSSEYRIACLKALSQVAGTAAVEYIITSSSSLRPQEKRIAENLICEMGLRTVPLLLALIKNTALKDPCRILAVRILSHLALPQLRANLSGIIKKEIERAYYYYYHQQTIEQKNPGMDLTLLKEALKTSYRSAIDFIIHLLGEAGEIEDCELLARSLASSHPKVRGQVVETLEKTCAIDIFRMLRPLVTDIPPEEKIRAFEGTPESRMNLENILEKMSTSPSQLEMMVASLYMKQLNMPKWRQSLLTQMQSQQEIFHHFAYELLEA